MSFRKCLFWKKLNYYYFVNNLYLLSSSYLSFDTIQYGILVVWSVYVRNAWVWVRLIHLSLFNFVISLHTKFVCTICAIYKIILFDIIRQNCWYLLQSTMNIVVYLYNQKLPELLFDRYKLHSWRIKNMFWLVIYYKLRLWIFIYYNLLSSAF